MQWTLIEPSWDQVQCAAKKQWDALSEGDLATIRESRSEFARRVKERYGLSTEDADHQINAFMRRQS